MTKKEIKLQEIETTIAKACKLIDIAQSTLDGLTDVESARLSEARKQLGYAFANVPSHYECEQKEV